MKIMTKGKMDFDTLLSSKIERRKLREDATEEEAEKMDLHDEIASLKAFFAVLFFVLSFRIISF
jgi:hypothetical protein